MPDSPMPLDLVDYARDLFTGDQRDFADLTEAAHGAGMPAEWEITPDVGRLFQVLCRAVGARRVLEFGTFAGHSALWFARALPPDGRVVSIEMELRHAELARGWLAGLAGGQLVDVLVGAARDMLAPLEEEVRHTGHRYDVVFLDADKAHYPEFLRWTPRVLRPGGLLLADNVLRSGSWGASLLDAGATDARIPAIREFNATLAARQDFTSVIVPMRAGVAVAVYTP